MDSLVSGLSQAEAEKRLREQGPNELIRRRKEWQDILWRQIIQPFALLLIAAASISFYLGDVIEACLISLFVFINFAIGFVQEYRSEKALDLLQAYARPTCRVMRDGNWKRIPSRELVVGDVIRVETGDIIPADAMLAVAQSLELDESVLSGESAPVNKTSDSPVLFSGTHVVRGEAVATVTATGSKTNFGKTAALAGETPRPSDFERGINNFGKFILAMTGITLLIVVLANILIKNGKISIGELLVFAIALAVSVIPEALPLVMSLSLSRGALRLARQNVVVRRLSAIEAAGSIDVLCTDKTGTLTQNKMTIEGVKGDEKHVLRLAAIGSREIVENKETPENPFDSAIYRALSPTERKQLHKAQIISQKPFDPSRRINSTLIEWESERILAIRGAPESVFAACKDGEVIATKHKEWMEARGAEGCRVLAIASREAKGKSSISDKMESSDLDFTGLIAFKDPVKPDAAEAIRTATRLHVRVVMLTGDAPEVAAAVAHEVRLLKGSSRLMVGPEYESLDEKTKDHAVATCDVFARVKPEQKFDIIRRLQKNHDVGFLGEGINDAPALAAADVGFVVQNAADIARESADIILLDKSLSVIMNGIRLGRETFSNTATYIRATLTSNFGNFYAIAFATLFIDQVPLLPAQILLVNLLTDVPMIAISTDAVDPEELHKPKKYDVREIVLIAVLLGLVSTLFDFIFFALFRSGPIDTLRTNWFIGSVLTELVLIVSIRTRLPFWRARTLSPSLFWMTLLAAVICLVIPIAPFASRFGFVTPSAAHLQTVLLVVLAYFTTTEVVKLLAIRFAAKKPA